MNRFYKKLAFQILIFILIIGAGTTGLIFFGSNIKNYVKKIIFARQEIVNRSSDLTSLAILKSQYSDKGKDYLDVFKSILPGRDQLIKFSKNLQQIAGQNKIDFGFSFTGESLATTSSLGFAGFNLNVKGGTNQLNQFFQELTKSQFLTVLDNLDFNRVDDNQQIIIRGRVFFR